MLRVCVCALLLGACAAPSSSKKSDGVEGVPTDSYATPLQGIDSNSSRAILPLPHTVELDPNKVALGRRLYFDQRLSGDHTVACADCHSLEKGGADGKAKTKLPGRGFTAVNVPTTFNVAFDFRFAWSGKWLDVAQQIDAAIASPDAMQGSWTQAVETLRNEESYEKQFSSIYQEGMTEQSMRDALATYTLALITPGSAFDLFLEGTGTLSDDAQRGYAMFRDFGCISCHQGINIGGNMFQRFGVMRDYFADRGDIQDADLGLYNTTKDPRDKHVFRVPSLRNVALTAPYFHDGSTANLVEAVQTMARYQLGRTLTDAQSADLVAFLDSLSGQLPEHVR